MASRLLDSRSSTRGAIMKRIILPAVALAVLALPSSALAQGRGQLGAFGGLTFGQTTSATTFGGNFSVPLASGVEVVAEAGRLEDVMPSTIGTLLDFTPVDLRLGAWYGEAGVRFVGSHGGAVMPYAEATAGFARMHTGFAGAGSADPFVRTALRFFDRTEPLLGAGAGVILRGGPLTLDVGYRYKKILASDSLQSVLSGGDISVNQARIGIGVRF
jgi:opacity protein-like surface antigen